MSASLAPRRAPPLAQFALAAGALWGGFLAIEGGGDARYFAFAPVSLGL